MLALITLRTHNTHNIVYWAGAYWTGTWPEGGSTHCTLPLCTTGDTGVSRSFVIWGINSSKWFRGPPHFPEYRRNVFTLLFKAGNKDPMCGVRGFVAQGGQEQGQVLPRGRRVCRPFHEEIRRREGGAAENGKRGGKKEKGGRWRRNVGGRQLH